MIDTLLISSITMSSALRSAAISTILRASSFASSVRPPMYTYRTVFEAEMRPPLYVQLYHIPPCYRPNTRHAGAARGGQDKAKPGNLAQKRGCPVFTQGRNPTGSRAAPSRTLER